MKRFSPTLFLGLIALLFVSAKCGDKGGKIGFDTPEATFNTLVKAIREKDMATYKQCWHPESAEREGMVSRLESDPSKWDELQGIFKGPQKIEKKDLNRDGTSCGMQIDAPEADGGGIGGLRMIKVGEEWKMKSW